MQDSTGGFGLWAPGNADMWLSAYVTDFLTRAKEQGNAVPQLPFAQALDRLQNSVAYASDFESGGEEIAYALYVLARNSRAPIGDLRYYADTRLDRFAHAARQGPYRRGARHCTATRSAPSGPSRWRSPTSRPRTESTGRYDYGSELRDGAAMLTLIAETGAARTASSRGGGYHRHLAARPQLYLDAGAGLDAARGARR